MADITGPSNQEDITDPIPDPPEEEVSKAGLVAGCILKSCRFVLDLFGLAFIAICLTAVGGYIMLEKWAERDQRKPGASQLARIEIRQGLSTRSIANALSRADLVQPPSLMMAYTLVHRSQGTLRAGEYEFAPGTPPKIVLAVLKKGPEAQSEKFTIPEGWTAPQIANRLKQRGIIKDPDRFLALCADVEFLSSIGIQSSNAEGFLYPDTYFMLRSTNEKDVIRKMTSRFSGEIQTLGLLPGLNSPYAYGLTYEQHIVLASILEREVADPKEMSLISSVYHNRLRKNMPLGSCATVRFALAKWRDPLTMEDLKVDSPFNTYSKAGLPPAPICNPGHTALEAAFRPEKSTYLYYVYKGNRQHVFSETLRDHEQARNKYKDLWLTWTNKPGGPEQ